MRRTVLFLFSLVLSVAFATQYPLSVTDDLGRTVTLDAEPLRIVTMLPSHTETLCAVNACDRIVGVDDYSNYPEQINALPDLGGERDADVEAIVALQPDLVLVSESGDLAQTLSDAGLTVFAGSPQTYDEVFEKFRLLGQLVNRETEAALLSGRVQGEIDATARLSAALPQPEVYYELDATPYSVGPDSFIGVLMSKAGGSNIVDAALGDFPQLDPEFVVSADPELIILSDAPYGENLTTLQNRPGWNTINAVMDGAVFELTPEQVDIINRPGPRIAEAVRLFAKLFHPERF